MTARSVVDGALDNYVRARRRRGEERPRGFRARTLARIAGVTRPAMSTLLQEYRRMQGRVVTRYVIGSERYGPDARWQILGMPGDGLSLAEHRRLHAVWVIRDNIRKQERDFDCEVIPALGDALSDDRIRELVDRQRQEFRYTLMLLETLLGSNGETA